MRITSVKRGPKLLYLVKGEWTTVNKRVELPSLVVREIHGNYFPNLRNLLFRLGLVVYSQTTLSFHLQVAYEAVKLKFKILDEFDKVILETDGGSNFVIPLVRLECESFDANSGKQLISNDVKSGERRIKPYFIEAYVLYNSWPLTELEWTEVESEKLKRRSLNKTKSSTSLYSKSSTKMSRHDSSRKKLKKSILSSSVSDVTRTTLLWNLETAAEKDATFQVLSYFFNLKVSIFTQKNYYYIAVDERYSKRQ